MTQEALVLSMTLASIVVVAYGFLARLPLLVAFGLGVGGAITTLW